MVCIVKICVRFNDHSEQFGTLNENCANLCICTLRYQLGMKFSTFDQDNDGFKGNCAVLMRGAWWYGIEYCQSSNLNGEYINPGSKMAGPTNVNWWHWISPHAHYSLKFTDMKIRSENFH